MTEQSLEALLSETRALFKAAALAESALPENISAEKMKKKIAQYLNEKEEVLPGMDVEASTEKLYEEMAGFSVITPCLFADDVEEININSWKHICVSYTDGRREILPEGFASPEAALDIVRKLLRISGSSIDAAKPVAQGHLQNNTRICAIQVPLVDDDVMVSASIRRQRPSTLTVKDLIARDVASRDMFVFLHKCMTHGVSFVVAGATDAGKTTLLNAMLDSFPKNKRMVTVESGARELAGGSDEREVVHMLSRFSETAAYCVSQEELVEASLRFNPDIIAVGEMRDIEAYSAVEAAMSGHTVVTTIHAGSAAGAHARMTGLCMKRFPGDPALLAKTVAQAFPVVVFVHKGNDGIRRIMEIAECVKEGEYRTLFYRDIGQNVFIEANAPSAALCTTLRQNGG